MPDENPYGDLLGQDSTATGEETPPPAPANDEGYPITQWNADQPTAPRMPYADAEPPAPRTPLNPLRPSFEEAVRGMDPATWADVYSRAAPAQQQDLLRMRLGGEQPNQIPASSRPTLAQIAQLPAEVQAAAAQRPYQDQPWAEQGPFPRTPAQEQVYQNWQKRGRISRGVYDNAVADAQAQRNGMNRSSLPSYEEVQYVRGLADRLATSPDPRIRAHQIEMNARMLTAQLHADKQRQVATETRDHLLQTRLDAQAALAHAKEQQAQEKEDRQEVIAHHKTLHDQWVKKAGLIDAYNATTKGEKAPKEIPPEPTIEDAIKFHKEFKDKMKGGGKAPPAPPPTPQQFGVDVDAIMNRSQQNIPKPVTPEALQGASSVGREEATRLWKQYEDEDNQRGFLDTGDIGMLNPWGKDAPIPAAAKAILWQAADHPATALLPAHQGKGMTIEDRKRYEEAVGNLKDAERRKRYLPRGK